MDTDEKRLDANFANWRQLIRAIRVKFFRRFVSSFVAQSFTLLYRRVVLGRPFDIFGVSKECGSRRMQFRGTAECNSALHFVGALLNTSALRDRFRCGHG